MFENTLQMRAQYKLALEYLAIDEAILRAALYAPCENDRGLAYVNRQARKDVRRSRDNVFAMGDYILTHYGGA